MGWITLCLESTLNLTPYGFIKITPNNLKINELTAILAPFSKLWPSWTLKYHHIAPVSKTASINQAKVHLLCQSCHSILGNRVTGQTQSTKIKPACSCKGQSSLARSSLNPKITFANNTSISPDKASSFLLRPLNSTPISMPYLLSSHVKVQ